MNETIRWNLKTQQERMNIACLLGWKTTKGEPDKTARKLSKQNWNQLSPAAQNILTRHGIEAY